MLGRGGLLGNDATRNSARDAVEQHPSGVRAQRHRGALGSTMATGSVIVQLAAHVGSGGVIGGGTRSIGNRQVQR